MLNLAKGEFDNSDSGFVNYLNPIFYILFTAHSAGAGGMLLVEALVQY